MLEYEFMRSAFAAAGAAAVLAGAVGYFLVLRGQTFAGHALSHVGFTGATGAALFGLSPLAGLIAFSAFAGLVMGLIGEKLAERDVAIGMTLSLALGLGLLFLHFYTSAASQATALLFGNVLGVDATALKTLLGLAAASLIALAWIARPLTFASLQAELAEAKGLPMRGLSVQTLLSTERRSPSMDQRNHCASTTWRVRVPSASNDGANGLMPARLKPPWLDL